MTEASERGRVEELVRQLSEGTGVEAEEARASLIHLGRDQDVVGPLIRVLPTMNRFGLLCAVEIMEDLADSRVARPLTGLLDSEHDTVRAWAAGALERLRVYDAVPALRRALEAAKQRHTAPDWSEPVALRSALTELGAREPVTPSLVSDLCVRAPDGTKVWPSSQLVLVIEELARHDQVTLYFMLWRVEPDDAIYWTEHRREGTDLDFTEPWPALVADARDRALREAAGVLDSDNVFARIEWIDRADL